MTGRIGRDHDARVVQRQHLKDIIGNLHIENSELLGHLKSLQETLDLLGATTKTDDLAMRDRLGALRAQIADDEAKNQLELKEIKAKYNFKLQEMRDASELRRAELLREYERLRGSKRELAAELARLRSTDMEQRIAYEEKVIQIEAGLDREERAANSHMINIADKNLKDHEKAKEQLESKIENQAVDIEKKRFKLYDTVRELEDKLRSLEEDVSDKRLNLARKQEENKRIGHNLRVKVQQCDKVEAELIDMKRTFDKLGDIERCRKEEAWQTHLRNKALAESVLEQHHQKIISLEKDIRETELRLQVKRARMQKLAEIVSCNVNRAIVATVSKHNLTNTVPCLCPTL